jgi:hypothetical protein
MQTFFPSQMYSARDLVSSDLERILSCLLTPWKKGLLEKLTVSQLFNKSPAFYNIRKFITAFTTARYLFLSWARSIQSMPLQPSSLRFTLVLSSHLRRGRPSCLLPSGFSTKTLYAPLLAPYALHALPISVYLIWSPNNIWWGVQIIKLLVMQSSPLLCYLVTLRPKYPPQHLCNKCYGWVNSLLCFVNITELSTQSNTTAFYRKAMFCAKI